MMAAQCHPQEAEEAEGRSVPQGTICQRKKALAHAGKQTDNRVRDSGSDYM